MLKPSPGNRNAKLCLKPPYLLSSAISADVKPDLQMCCARVKWFLPKKMYCYYLHLSIFVTNRLPYGFLGVPFSSTKYRGKNI